MKEENRIEAKISSIAIIIYISLFILVLYILYSIVSREAIIPNYEYYVPINFLLIIIEIAILVHIVRAVLLRFTTKLYFTKTKIVGRLGVLNVTTLDAPLNKINDIFITKSIFGRILNYSKIVISTSSSKYIFYYVADADNFKDTLTKYIENNDTKKETKINTSNNYDQLKQIKELLDNGILTQEEYEKEKSKLLNDK